MKFKQILCSLVILSLVFALSELSMVQAQSPYSIDLETITWTHSTLSVLIVMPGNESWWNPSYLNATLRAIGEWNNAILDFASNYTDYAYLSAVRMVPSVAHAMNSGFDVYISWMEKPPSGANEIGLTETMYSTPSRIIANSTTDLYSRTLLGYVLNEVDMQNVALHELGHSLGLGHSNYTKNIMYPMLSVSPLKQVQALSTLDLYGVSIVFQWMSNSSFPYSPRQSAVTLPSNIAYQYLPISNANLPPPAAPYSSLIDELWKFITSGSIGGLPPFIVMITSFIIGLVVGFFVKKFLKIAIIVGIIVVIISYFGLFNLSLSALGNLATQYGPIAIHYATILIGILPLSIGFIVGLIIGFIFG